MSRHIDADVFKQMLESRQNMYDENEDDMALNECACIIKMLDNAPTADVVEVVRCRDCKYCTEKKAATMTVLYCELNGHFISKTHFCSYGERREE